MHDFYEKLKNLRTRTRILKNSKDKIHIYTINMVNCGKQLMMAHGVRNFYASSWTWTTYSAPAYFSWQESIWKKRIDYFLKYFFFVKNILK